MTDASRDGLVQMSDEQLAQALGNYVSVYGYQTGDFGRCVLEAARRLRAASLEARRMPDLILPEHLRCPNCKGGHFRRVQVEMHDGIRADLWHCQCGCEFAVPRVLAADPPAPPAATLGQWLPIESAPKDGRLVLLYPSRGWAEDVNCDCEVGYWDQFTNTWLAYGPTAEDYTGATHWMPLPAAPAPASPEEK